MSDTIQLNDSWKNRLTAEFAQPYMQQLKGFLLKRKEAGARVYPRGQNIFNALNTTDFDNVKVVILGQDPYHGPGQAHGLSFSVPEGVPHPPSLQNIFKELTTDVGKPVPRSGNLQSWAEQGVLLLNSVLTVEEGQAAAHAGKGWEQFTDKVIHLLNDEREHVVFILWGSYAQAKGKFIDRRKHLVIESPHPSPLSAHRGFFGSKPFSKANAYLTQHGLTPINW